MSSRNLKLLVTGLGALALAALAANIAPPPASRVTLPPSLVTPPISAPGPAVASEPGTLAAAFTEIAETVVPAVVRIQAELASADDSGRRPRLEDLFGPDSVGGAPPVLTGGTGFLVSADGLILTNNHVVDDAVRVSVTLRDKRVFDARVLGRDPTTDIAALKIEATGLPSLQLGDSDSARVGEWVLAIGNPGFGGVGSLDFTVTSGIISAKGRPLNIIPQSLYDAGVAAAGYAIEDFIQTDAVINPGNSGGPLLNLRGEAIGITSAIASTTGFNQGYGFAIPSNIVRRVVRDLVEYGHVRRALLGVAIADVTPEDAELYGLASISGVRVDDFEEDSPAHTAGIERHDVIVAVDGEPIQRVGQLQRVIAQRSPGDVVRVRVVRFGESNTFDVRLALAPIPEPEPTRTASPRPRRSGDLGIELIDITRNIADYLGLDGPGGALVDKVAPNSPAALKGIDRGDRILAIDRQQPASAKEARALLRGARSGSIVSLLVVGRSGRTRIANIRVP